MTPSLHLENAEIEIRKNEDAEPSRASEFPDGFLNFRYTLEFFVDPNSSQRERATMVAKVLQACWRNEWPAVAACDYEEELPENGGFKSTTVPWPGRKKALEAPQEEQVVIPIWEATIRHQLQESLHRRKKAGIAAPPVRRLESLQEQLRTLEEPLPLVQPNRPSRVDWLLPYLKMAPYRSAPERASELRRIVKDYSIRVDFVNDSNCLSNVDLDSRIIRFSVDFLERIWAYSYAYLEIVRLSQAHGAGSDIDIPPPVQRQLVALYETDVRSRPFVWGNDLPRPDPGEVSGSNGFAATELTLIVGAFIQLHEIAHIVLGHRSDDSPESYVPQEYEADDWAGEWMLNRWQEFGAEPDDNVFIKRSLGGTLCFGHLAALESHMRRGEGVQHPDPPDRLLHFLDRFVPRTSGSKAHPKELAWYVSVVIVQLHMQAAGKAMDAGQGYYDGRDFLVAASQQMKEK